MPLLPTLGRTVGTGVRAVRLLVRGSVRGSAWATRRVGDARAKGAANEIGMVRLFDLHAISCAGDTLIAIGLAGTIFFNAPLGEARSKVALYLLITMVPFALLAPVVGPLLDHFRHGRRYALASTMLGRAFLAYVISDNLLGFGLYPAAFGVLALSRAYGVARSAAVPRLLPDGVGLSQVGARASLYGTFAGAIVAPIGLAAFWVGPQWSLRVASVIFIVGMVISLRLPPRADSDPPEEMPRPIRTVLRLRRGTDRPLSGPLVVNTLIGSASLRLLYGFLLLYFAFAIKAGDLATTVAGRDFGNQGAVALIGGALAAGTFLATAIGTRLRIRRPTALQSSGLTITAGVAVLATIFYTLPMVALLSLVAAVFSGISKLAIDASIQERVPERLRSTAFAHSETVLMMAWVIGGAVGIIPFTGRLGVAMAAALAVTAALRAGYVAARLHGERLHGRPDSTPDDETRVVDDEPSTAAGDSAAPATRPGEPADPWPDAPTVAPPSRGGTSHPAAATRGTTQPGNAPARGATQPPARGTTQPAAQGTTQPAAQGTTQPAAQGTTQPAARGATRPAEAPARGGAGAPRPAGISSGAATGRPGPHGGRGEPSGGRRPTDGGGDHGDASGDRPDPTLVEPPARPKRRFGWPRRSRSTGPSPSESHPTAAQPTVPQPTVPQPTVPQPAVRQPTAHQPTAHQPTGPDPALAPPGYHVYRPSSAAESHGDQGAHD